MMDNLTQQLHAHGDLLNYVLPAAVAVILLWIAWRILRRRKSPTGRLAADLRIEIESLGADGPPEGPPVLEFYNLPMRLAAVVMAPAGLGRELPPNEELGLFLESVIPGLDKVADLHRPAVRRWPNQLSPRGFAHLFFNNARLPGAGGKGTPWSSVAGLCKFGGEPMLIGLILRAAAPNSLGQTIIEAEHQWLGCLRVKWG